MIAQRAQADFDHRRVGAVARQLVGSDGHAPSTSRVTPADRPPATQSLQQALARVGIHAAGAGARERRVDRDTASVEIATGNQDLSQRTEQTASNLQQTASSMEQLTGTVHADAPTRRARPTSSPPRPPRSPQRGGAVVSQVVTTMDEIKRSSQARSPTSSA